MGFKCKYAEVCQVDFALNWDTKQTSIWRVAYNFLVKYCFLLYKVMEFTRFFSFPTIFGQRKKKKPSPFPTNMGSICILKGFSQQMSIYLLIHNEEDT